MKDQMLDMRGFSGGGGAKNISNPFVLPSTDLIPQDIPSALRLARELYKGNPRLQLASRRTNRHFLKDFKAKNYAGNDASASKQVDFFKDDLNILAFFAKMLDDADTYGNAFGRIIYPFDRWLLLPEKRLNIPLNRIPEKDLSFDTKSMRYRVRFKDGSVSLMDFKDIPVKDPSTLKLKTLCPEDMTIRYNEITGAKDYIWRIPPIMRAHIRSGKLFYINTTPRHLLEAVLGDKDLLFNTEEVLHLASPWITDRDMEPWGYPTPLAIFSSLFKIQIYRKVDEVVGLDRLLPMRVFTPNLGTSVSANDINNFVEMSHYTSEIDKLIKEHRRSPFSMFSAPFPLNLQSFGTENNDMVSKDRLEYQNNEAMDAAGYPAEFTKGTISVDALPSMLRMFESSKLHIPRWIAQMVNFFVPTIQSFAGWAHVEMEVPASSLAADIERNYFLFELSQQRQISTKTALRNFHIENPEKERKEAIREDLEREREMAAAQQEMMDEQNLGLTPEGDEAVEGSGGAAAPVTDQHAKAEEIAMQWLSLPTGDRQRQMESLRNQDQPLYALAMFKKDEILASAESEGRQMVYAQFQGG